MMKHYEEPNVKVLVLSCDDVVRVSGVNGSDNDGSWDSGWDRPEVSQ